LIGLRSRRRIDFLVKTIFDDMGEKNSDAAASPAVRAHTASTQGRIRAVAMVDPASTPAQSCEAAEPPIDWIAMRIAETLREHRRKRLRDADPLIDPEGMPLIGAPAA
jgi:hypothetical protein